MTFCLDLGPTSCSGCNWRMYRQWDTWEHLFIHLRALWKFSPQGSSIYAEEEAEVVNCSKQRRLTDAKILKVHGASPIASVWFFQDTFVILAFSDNEFCLINILCHKLNECILFAFWLTHYPICLGAIWQHSGPWKHRGLLPRSQGAKCQGALLFF